MAVTKIKPIHSTLRAAIKYITNPKKTDDFALVDSYGCVPETAHLEFAFTADSFGSSSAPTAPDDGGLSNEKGKEGKKEKRSVLAYHVIQSFKPDEVSKEVAHEIGLEFARTITGKKHEFIVSTHVDKHHIHNHIIFNAVDFKSGKKYHSNYRSYKEVRACSDRLCAEHGLSVITEPKEKGKSYFEWMMANEGKSYKEALRKDLDSCIASSLSFDDLLLQMGKLGYEVKFGKYISFKAPGQEKFTRAKSLGSLYTEEKIKERILEKASGKHIKEVSPSSPSAPSIGLISSVEGMIADARSSRATAKSDLRKLNATYLFLKDAGIDSLEELSQRLQKNATDSSALRLRIRSLESKIEPYEEYLKYASTYSELKGVYELYKKSGCSKEFEASHRREIMLFELAASFLKNSPLSGDTPVRLSKIKKECEQLKKEIDTSYEALKVLKDTEKELSKVKKNIEGILGSDAFSQYDKKKSTDRRSDDVFKDEPSEKDTKKTID